MGMSIKSILCLFFALVVFALPAYASGLFTVDNITVDVTADNAINARGQAFEDAQIKAFKELSKRLLNEGEAESITTPDAGTISTMVQDFEVTNEKLSSVRYIGTYTFTFDEAAVRRQFTSTGQSYTTTQSRPLLILPFYKKGRASTLWSPANHWMRAWTSGEKRNPLVPLVLPIGDLNDVRDVKDHNYLNFDSFKMARIVDRYDAGEAVIILAEADEHLSLVNNPNQPATGHLTVTIYRTDRGYAEAADQFSIMAKPDQTLSALMLAAAKKAQKALTTDWKSRTVVSASESSRLKVKVPLQSLSDWTGIRRSLDRTHLITKTTLDSLSPRAAMITMEFQGNIQRLSLALDQVNLVLGQERGDFINAAADALVPSYILTRKSRLQNSPSYSNAPTYDRNYAQEF